MNLRTVRIRLALLYTALSGIAIVALAAAAIRDGTARIMEGADREAEDVVSTLTVSGFQTGELVADNTWFVHIGEGDDVYDNELGDTWVEPPLLSVAGNAIAYDVEYTRFVQDEVRWLAFGRRLNDTDAFVTAVDLTEYESRASSLRLRIWLSALGAVAAVGVVGWLVTGRSLRPAKLANLRQRDFVADAAHELRTPLAVIRASASQVLSRPRDAETYRAALEEIDVAAERAGAAVVELLELARIDAGQYAPRLAPLRLDLLVEEVAAGIRVEGCTISAQADEPIDVDADYALLRQAVENIARNAASRSTRTGIHASQDERRAVIEVADDGPGFPDALLPHVFERFRRGDGRGSSGLGLAIARSIVESHGGSIEAANRPAESGGGAVVRLTLPRPRRTR